MQSDHEEENGEQVLSGDPSSGLNDSPKQGDVDEGGAAIEKDRENTPSEDSPHEEEIKAAHTDPSCDDQEEESATIQEASETKTAEQQEVVIADPANGREAKEEERQTSLEAEDPKPPVSILKESSYVVAEQDDAVGTSQAKTEKHRERRDEKKSVYLWQLVSKSA